MLWNKLSQFLQGHPQDLVEAYFEDMSPHSWRKLFAWLEGRVRALDNQYGRLHPDELNVELFLDGSMSYIAHIRGERDFELSLLIIEKNELSIDIELEDISEEGQFLAFLDAISQIASVTGCEKTIVCQEFQRETPFLVNGKLAL